MINEKNIEDTVSTVVKVASSIIDNMAVDSRLTTKDFVSQVVEEAQVPVAIAAGVVALVVNNCTTVKARAGRNGGIYKIANEIATSKDISAVAAAISGTNDIEDEDSDDEDYGE